jgi:hypothetical protein
MGSGIETKWCSWVPGAMLHGVGKVAIAPKA